MSKRPEGNIILTNGLQNFAILLFKPSFSPITISVVSFLSLCWLSQGHSPKGILEFCRDPRINDLQETACVVGPFREYRSLPCHISIVPEAAWWPQWT